jgi:carboxyl-terminal processing protease
MRGKPDTSITLTVIREGEAEPLIFTLVRAIIKIESVKSKLVEPGYGYIRITQFQERTGEALAEAISKIYKESKVPLKGLVLDLRNDPGGLLNSAVAVSAAFLPKNSLIVYTEGRTPDAKMQLRANPEYYLRNTGRDFLENLPQGIKTVPMVTLVNGGSASASEIVAGALQDYKRSVIMGSQTFGKGSVQTILPLTNNTAIKLTTARYYTPNGQSIQAKGITPDILDEETDDNSRLLREVDLNRHLDNGQKEDSKKKTTESSKKLKKKDDKDTKKHELMEFGSEDDQLLTKAINHLKTTAQNLSKK